MTYDDNLHEEYWQEWVTLMNYCTAYVCTVSFWLFLLPRERKSWFVYNICQREAGQTGGKLSGVSMTADLNR